MHFWWGNEGPALSNLFMFTQLVKGSSKLNSGFSLFFVLMTHTSCCAVEYPPWKHSLCFLSSPLGYGQGLRTSVLHRDAPLCPGNIWSVSKGLGWRHSFTLFHCIWGRKILPASYRCFQAIATPPFLSTLLWGVWHSFLPNSALAIIILRPYLPPLRTSLCLHLNYLILNPQTFWTNSTSWILTNHPHRYVLGFTNWSLSTSKCHLKLLCLQILTLWLQFASFHLSSTGTVPATEAALHISDDSQASHLLTLSAHHRPLQPVFISFHYLA